ncbi:uncharacterized protein LOC131845012 isoform X2 [Achroia grisella]|uniref:uncharacterized protein LOC131845012 isoform X2 n=1 Tax=Achroia grisella TaxID=688607 RepID=UPI0027D25333|nr:uncharacterized protein LOC131845012 isoform X2 [Achroia grisella]
MTCFSKKLLVATCILAIIMCLTQSEAASIAHKRHGRSQDNMTKLTKEQTLEQPEIHAKHKRRHQRLNKMYVSKMDNIVRKLEHTLVDFKKHWRNLNESNIYRNSTKIRLPHTNFTEILFRLKHQNKSQSSFAERRFKYLIPKLYKSLMSYYAILEFLSNIETTAVNVDFGRYLDKRKKSFPEITNNLYSTMEEIRIDLENVSMIAPVKDNKAYLKDLKHVVDEGECYKYDVTVFKRYDKFLNGWFCVMTNSKNRTIKQNKKCARFQTNQKKRRQHWRQKIRKRRERRY